MSVDSHRIARLDSITHSVPDMAKLWHGACDVAGSILPYSLKFWEWTSDSQWTVDNMPDVRGKVAIVTGGNGSIGLETCCQLVKGGAHVFLGARSREKFILAQRAIQRRLQSEHLKSQHVPDGDAEDDEMVALGKLEYLHCDLSSTQLASEAANEFLRRDSANRLDIFVACAGLGAGKGKLIDGMEPFMATNCVNHFVMLHALMPLILKSAQGQASSGRIVFVSSAAHYWSSLPPFLGGGVPVTFESWENVNDDRRSESMLYAQSKLAQILMVKRLTLELAKNAADKSVNVACLAIHPGEINNAFVHRHFVGSANRLGILSFVGQVRPLLRYFLLDEQEGARTCLYAATASEIDKETLRGAYLTYPCHAKEPSQLAMDMNLAQKCWTLVEEKIKAALPRAVDKVEWSS